MLIAALAEPPVHHTTFHPPRGLRPVVAFYRSDGNGGPLDHDASSKAKVAESLASLLGLDFAGEFDLSLPSQAPVYLVPSDTLPSLAAARRLGIRGVEDLFGGVVPAAFVATKVVSHPLVRPDAAAPPGWSTLCAESVRDAALPGYSVFSASDAHEAAVRLLRGGSLRVKDPAGVGGLGQWVVRDEDELEEHLTRFGDDMLGRHGLVLERNLNDVVTYSVGHVRVGHHRASYYGTQGLTRNHQGLDVYGGSSLVVCRGGFEDLLGHDMEPQVHQAVEQALAFHRAIMQGYPDLIASRCNYDVAFGVDDHGQAHGGVLEQSWRIGGASGAEAAALHAFAADPSLQRVRASTCEIYADQVQLPAGAWLLYDGPDRQGGRLVKFAQVTKDVDA
jgi:hypothetical protein